MEAALGSSVLLSFSECLHGLRCTLPYLVVDVVILES